MQISTFRPGVIALAACALLAACGGGGNSVVASTPTSPTTPTTPTTPITPTSPTTTTPTTPTTPTPVAAKACDPSTFAATALVDAKVLSATMVEANAYKPAGSNSAIANLPAFCLVKAQATPTSDSLINFEVWVPRDNWNQKLVATGNGGYSPALSYGDMAYAMRQGYATLGGDTGHQSADGNDMFFGVGHPEKIRDWGTRSINAITVPGKQIVAQLQGTAAKRAYYYGASTGGHQAYAEIQRYPQDFDGVIAGAPGNNRTALNAEFLWRYLSNRVPNTNTLVLTSAKAALITRSAIAACDAIDGVADGVLADPRACTSAQFNLDSLLCPGADAATCLTADQIAAARKIYAGPKNPRTAAQIYPGPVVGSESGWSSYWGGTAPTRSDFWALWVYDNPQWNWWTFDFDRDMSFSLAKVGPLVDQNSTDLSAFKARGGKLITFQGWIDPVVNANDTIAYYEKVRTAQGSQQNIDGFFRLFLAPGMGHVSGGTGPVVFGNGGLQAPNPSAANDLLMALDKWVETDSAPATVVASQVQAGAVVATRPLCAYPKAAVYKGSGATTDAGNFSCQ